MKVKSESEVAQWCPTLSDPMDCSPPGSSIHGIFQARVLEWSAIVTLQVSNPIRTLSYLCLSLLFFSQLLVRPPQWHPTPILLPGKPHGRRSLVGCSPWDRSQSDTTERLHFHFHGLEKEIATHSSVLAWRIPGTGEPGGLPSMGSQRV